MCLRKALTLILLQAGYDKAYVKHNLCGIIAPVADYLKAYKEAFVFPKCIDTYPKNPKEEKDQMRRLEAIWKMRLEDYTLYNTDVCVASAFILSVEIRFGISNCATIPPSTPPSSPPRLPFHRPSFHRCCQLTFDHKGLL